jgi:predicted dehydrogenase
MPKPITRRQFNTENALAAAAVLGSPLAARAAQQSPGANDRIRLGMIGVGNRGGQLLAGLLTQADAQIVAICDIYRPHLERTSARLAQLGIPAEPYHDFRRLIDRSDLDAIVIATPDHWHAVQTVTACRAGKDVYVEKPLSVTIAEGRRMVEVARETARVVQVGTHRRSSKLWKHFAQQIVGGAIGKTTVSRAYRLSNMAPHGIGKLPPSDPPSDLDWDLWLGPRPTRPYQANIAPYKFRWWQSYSSQMGNWGVHYFDAMLWCLGEQSPTAVCAMGGQFAVEDDRTIPDTAQAMFEFPSGHLALFGQFEASGNPALPGGAELEIRGTNATALIGGTSYQLVPERGGQFQDPGARSEPVEFQIAGENDVQTAAHLRNFLDCVKSRATPAADVERGHRATSLALLANMSLAMRNRLEWDPQQERVTNLAAANELLNYEYRHPWTLD